MSVLAVLAGKGSPGVTTTAVLLAAVWPRPSLLLEADPAGGDLTLLLPAADGGSLSPAVGVMSLAAATQGTGQPDLAGHLQQAAGGLMLLAGTERRAQSDAVSSSWPALLEVATADTVDAGPGRDVIVDCGRVDDGAPSAVLDRADLVLLVCRGTAVSVWHALSTLRALQQHRGRSAGSGLRPATMPVGVVVLGDGPIAAEAAQVLQPCRPVFVTSVPIDARGAAGLCGAWTRALDRRPLVDAGRHLARLCDRTLSADPLLLPNVPAPLTMVPAAAANAEGAEPDFSVLPTRAQVNGS